MFGSRYRSILASLLAAVMVLLASCGDAPEAAAPTYTADTIARLQSYRADIVSMRDRMSELDDLIQSNDWIDVDNFIHGPLGTLRKDMSLVNRNLLPADQSQGRELAREVFRHLEEINAAADKRAYQPAVRNYRETLADLDAFLELIPDAPAEE